MLPSCSVCLRGRFTTIRRLESPEGKPNQLGARMHTQKRLPKFSIAMRKYAKRLLPTMTVPLPLPFG